MHRSAHYFDDQVRLEKVAPMNASQLVRTLILMIAVISALLVTVVIHNDLEDAEQKFEEQVAFLQDHVYNTLLTNQTILESFAAFLSVVGYQNSALTQDYVDSLIKRYESLYFIEVAHRVSKAELGSIVRAQVESGNPDFKIRAYKEGSRKDFVAIGDKDFYYPIVFVAPATEAQRSKALGADLESIPSVRSSMMEALRGNITVLSPPFELMEGEFGYVMLAPTKRELNETGDYEELIVLLAVRAKDMLPAESSTLPGSGVALFHAAYLKGQREGLVQEIRGDSSSALERALFPVLRFSEEVGRDRQKFKLQVDWQLGWDNISCSVLFGLLLLDIILVIAAIVYGRKLKAHEESLKKARYGLFILANYDSLTQLPNKPHLLNHLHNLMTTHHQSNYLLAILSIEIEDFKEISRRFGDVIGDALLVTVINRINRHLNEEYFLARVTGARLMIVSENFMKRAQAEALAENIRTEIKGPLLIGGNEVPVKLSVGVSLYPEDGDEIKELMETARDNAK